MKRFSLSRLGLPALLIFLVASAVMLIGTPHQAKADSGDVCNAAMVFDRSGSVGATNLNTMEQQVLLLFDPTSGLYSDNIKLAFWSFSEEIYPDTRNYNAPFNGFVSSKGPADSNFKRNLFSMVSAGATNYEQGFGFNEGVMNTHDNIDQDVITPANIIVFMTDGVPNTPGTGDNNATARKVARNAVIQLKHMGKVVVGGIVGGASAGSLNYVINGSDTATKETDPTLPDFGESNTFKISSQYTDLADKLKTIIGKQCDPFINPPITKKYSLVPRVTLTSGRVISQGGTAHFSYDVNNSNSDDSEPTNWAIDRVLVDKDQPIAPLYFDRPYADGYSCSQLVARVNNNATCEEVARSSSTRTFPAGEDTYLDGDSKASPFTNVTMQDDWGIGKKICFVLTVDRPTQSRGLANRFSQPACSVIGMQPSVQILGGDLRVGRYFADGSSNSQQSPSGVWTSISIGSDKKTYGSWVEYGVLAPGPIEGVASLSGLEGGYGGTPAECDSKLNKLTFANQEGKCGNFTDPTQVGTIPNVAAALLVGREVTKDLSGVTDPYTFDENSKSGLYQNLSGNVTIGESTIGKGKSIIVNVPDGTVTIKGNISYNDGPYTNLGQIPQLVIIANTIKIDPSVVNVDAWLIANGSDGTVSTCDDPDTLTINVCDQALRMNGPVMARHLDLRRTAGAGSNGDPAEVINLPGTSYLWSQNAGHSDVRAETTFTTELPPYF